MLCRAYLGKWDIDAQKYVNIGTERDDKKAKAVLGLAADKGDAFAAFMLGQMDPFAHNSKTRFQLAFTGLNPLAEQGNPLAQLCLASMYAAGHGVKQNTNKAIQLYRKSAEQGHAEAQKMLCDGYVNEMNGMKKDEKQAAVWCARAAAAGYDEAEKKLIRRPDLLKLVIEDAKGAPQWPNAVCSPTLWWLHCLIAEW